MGGERLNDMSKVCYMVLQNFTCIILILNAIANATGEPSPSISAQLRNFRKPSFQPVDAIYEVEKRYVSKGVWEYKLIVVPNKTMFKKVI